MSDKEKYQCVSLAEFMKGYKPGLRSAIDEMSEDPPEMFYKDVQWVRYHHSLIHILHELAKAAGVWESDVPMRAEQERKGEK